MNSESSAGIRKGAILDGKYRVERIIGAGGMGEVYEATHTLIGRTVAIKTLHASFVQNESVLQRFQREAQLAGSIGHDNICEVTDVGTTEDGSPYLVMPLLRGAALAEIITAKPRLSIARLIDIVCQTLSALEAAHKAQIVHRDLKPDNIFITKIGDRDDFVKLLDFGISKVLDQDSVLSLTRTGTVLGTPYYMSPEQAKGSKDVDSRGDIYAIGVILYEALTGTRPFDGDSYNEVMFKIIAEPFPPPRTIDSKIPQALEQVVLTAMARDPADRYTSAEEMRTALAASVSDAHPASIHQAEAATLPAESDRVNRAPTAATDTATPLATESTTGTQWKQPARSKPVLAVAIASIVVIVAGISALAAFILMRNDPAGQRSTVPLSTPAAAPASLPTVQTPPVAVEPAPPVQPTAQVSGPAKESSDEPATASEPESATKKKKKKRRKKSRSVAAKEEKPRVIITAPPEPKAPPQPAKKEEKKKGVVKGRFGTNIVSDYED